MDFERHSNPKKALNVGLSAATLNLDKILLIRYDKLPSRIQLPEKTGHRLLMIIQNNPKKFFKTCKTNKRAYGFVPAGENDSHWMMENLAGELVRFNNRLYAIPAL